MPDSAKRAAATDPRRKTAGGPPLKTKAEKKAEARAAKARARALEKRRQMLSVAGTAAVVLALIVGLVVWIGTTSSSKPAASTASAEATTPSPAPTEPSAAAFPPVPAGADPALSTKPVVTKGTGTITKLTTTTLIQGTGPAVETGQTVTVNYVLVTYQDGKESDSSWQRKEPFSFKVGAGQVIKGWDQGLVGVKVGSRVQLDIPAALAYGEHPASGPGGVLRFVVDVLSVS